LTASVDARATRAKARNEGDSDDGNDVPEGPAEHRCDHDRQEQFRESQKKVDDAADHPVDDTPEITGRHPEYGSEKGCQSRRNQPEQQRIARSVDHPGQHVPAELVGAEPMRPGRLLVDRQDALRQRIVGGEPGRQDRDEKKNHHDGKGKDRRGPAEEHVLQQRRPTGFRRNRMFDIVGCGQGSDGAWEYCHYFTRIRGSMTT
jgi:hypothetical protein